MCGCMSNASAKYEDNKREAATGNRSPRRHQLEAPSEEGAGRQQNLRLDVSNSHIRTINHHLDL